MITVTVIIFLGINTVIYLAQMVAQLWRGRWTCRCIAQTKQADADKVMPRCAQWAGMGPATALGFRSWASNDSWQADSFQPKEGFYSADMQGLTKILDQGGVNWWINYLSPSLWWTSSLFSFDILIIFPRIISALHYILFTANIFWLK